MESVRSSSGSELFRILFCIGFFTGLVNFLMAIVDVVLTTILLEGKDNGLLTENIDIEDFKTTTGYITAIACIFYVMVGCLNGFLCFRCYWNYEQLIIFFKTYFTLNVGAIVQNVTEMIFKFTLGGTWIFIVHLIYLILNIMHIIFLCFLWNDVITKDAEGKDEVASQQAYASKQVRNQRNVPRSR